jgi:heterodisulfide reductase subunit A
VVATGYDLFKWEEAYGEYGYGKYPDVITGMQFERMNNASGPTGGKIMRPSDGKEPKTVVFIKCVGSRDEAKGKSLLFQGLLYVYGKTCSPGNR